MTTSKNPHILTKLFDNNQTWVDHVTKGDPDYFQRLASQQSPEYLWIGCSDSRVPANQIIGLAPGEIFVHRNIANVVVHTDLNALSVIQFAVDQLKVKHIIVVGHYGCSGVKAALDNIRVGLADNWIRHIKDVDDKHGPYLGQVLDYQERFNHLCELNVIEQVVNVCETTIVQDAWLRNQELTVHGWIYGLKDGLARDLGMSIQNMAELKERYAIMIDSFTS
ncbi:carbonic anhydrase [Polynucleobacter sp. SHI8]|uniref:carbonate dehydratase n=1 Tax=unclassified Polynucleobacter TaxID=2640945 RepID=UPI00249367BB|nr:MULTISPECIES: carbonate dehydratase [unclassified Polynucleobacter]BDW12199.1 carbonic anhydrase [Polynucleobacter sp. SHI2]BDW14647.1 carbonic anhydrase [Polynucleobacter sp. SHI8]